jgi:hypothetical protein
LNSDTISMVYSFTGPRGSGKTLVQTADMCRRLIRSYLLKLMGEEYERIFSNYPVGFMYYPGHGLPSKYLEPEPLNMEALYVFDKGFYKCRIYLDEEDQWLDRQEWATTTQQMLAKSAQLLRKRKMSISGTIQSFNWLNSKLQFQTDLVVKARDAAFTPWGRSKKLALGEASFTDWMDKSGVLTGYSYEETQKLIPVTVQGMRFWNCYDTSFEFDPMETSTRYSLVRKRKVIDYTSDDGNNVDNVEGSSPRSPSIRDKNYHSEKKKDIEIIVAEAANQFMEQELTRILRSDMLEKIAELCSVSKKPHFADSEVYRAISRLGIKSCGHNSTQYDLYPLYTMKQMAKEESPNYETKKETVRV